MRQGAKPILSLDSKKTNCMCGRFVLVDKIEVVEKVFNAKFEDNDTLFSPNYNVSVGQKSLVITNEFP